MNEKFIELISNNYDDKYIEYLKELKEKPVAKKMIEILKEDDLTKRLNKWNDLEVKLSEIKDLNILSNPYYIGYGNPNSEILFLGKEKAFSVTNNPDLFFHESINNNKQWELSASKDNSTNLEFDPLIPTKYFKLKNSNFKIKKRTTWGMYCDLLKRKYSDELDISEDTFFQHCFTTEVNHKPSKTSKNETLDDRRLPILQNEFFKTFKYVIIGAINSIDKEGVKKIFGDDFIIDENKPIGKNKARSINITTFKNDRQKIILCNQLSGAAGWTEPAIQNLINEIR
jgi:hypothetical protein